MPSLFQILLSVAVPILGIAIFFSPWLQEATSIASSLLGLQAQDGPQVKLLQGNVLGTLLDDKFPAPVEAFLGLPYAQPPVRERRFRRPVALAASEKNIQARKYGARCPGKPILGEDGKSSEDCMTVNIFRQRPGNNTEKLPVAVNIHGGAYNRGTSRMHNTASIVAWSESPFVGVSFNYRLGALGFLPSQLTFDEGIVNLGLHDQAFLLQWVQDNIEEFGGNKNDVTIFGLSAGAHSVGHHILNYNEGVSPPFHKAILDSGAPTSRSVNPYNAPLQEAQFQTFLTLAGCSSVPSDTVISCLQSKSESTITAASDAVFAFHEASLQWAFQPVIDHEIIHQRPIDAWDTFKWNKVLTMTGHSTNEASHFIPPSISTSAEFTAFWHTLLPHLDDEDLQRLEALYPDPAIDPKSKYLDTRDIAALGLGAQYKRLEAAYAHYAYICPVRQTASYISSSNWDDELTEPVPPVYVYHLAANSSVVHGAAHGSNMEYQTFSNSVTQISEVQKEIAGTYHAYVTSFITKGDPNVLEGRWKNRPKWPVFESKNIGGGEAGMTFGKGNDERAGGEGRGTAAEVVGSRWVRRHCEFWMEKSRATGEEGGV